MSVREVVRDVLRGLGIAALLAPLLLVLVLV